MRNQPLGIIGHGIVGKAFTNTFKDTVRLFVYDKNIPECQNNLPLVLANCYIIFVAVPTPMKESGEIDLSYIHEVLDSLKYEHKLVVIRSTIVSGTTKELQKTYSNLRIVYNPEFLSERNSLADMERTDRVVIGGKPEDCDIVQDIYNLVFPQARYVLTDSTTAEMIKYAANVTLAGQVMIANDLFRLCQTLETDWSVVRNTIILDPLIGKNNKVPGPDKDLGFGGKCLPKDLRALTYLASTKGLSLEMLNQIWESNLKVRTNLDWLTIEGATSK